MKVAITSGGNKLDSKIDSHFGRCSYFVFYDTETHSLEFLPNPYKDLNEEVGISVARFIASRKVNKIITSKLGSKVKPVLDQLKIQLIILQDSDKSIKELIKMLNN